MGRGFKLIFTVALLPLLAAAQPSPKLQDALKRVFNSSEFSGGGGRGGRGGGGAHWLEDGRWYTAMERGQIVRIDAASGKSEVFVSTAQLTPKETGKPLAFSEYSWPAGGKKLMVAVSPHRVLIRKPAAEYWVLDLASGAWHKLGGDDGADLLYPKFSPDGTRVAYVRGTNLFVENLATGAIRPLTTDGTGMILNGVSDWVYDEEFRVNDCFRWSPDGERIAYWQFDQSGVKEYALVNYTDSLYPVIFKYPYPKAGETNSAVRVGVVSAAGGATHWMEVPGDSRNIYIARMDWAGPREVILEQLNRLQNTLDVLLCDAATGQVRRMFRDQDAAWVEVNDRLRWVDGGARLLWTSERDGWRHAYTISREGDFHLVTNFAGDVISISAVDAAGGWLYFIASPDDPVRRYLYRAKLDGSGKPERLTPPGQPGSHNYDIAPDGRFAFHTWSRFDAPPATELVQLPEHTTVRATQGNAGLRERVGQAMAGRTEFVKVDAGGGVIIDGWVMKPRDFDPAKKYPILVYVYGEPAGANAVDQWSGNRNLFHAAIADEGYLVASFDNSGTPSPKGREWRKSIYGAVGVLASQQQAAALRSLAAARPWVDLSRVAVWGWSGGGSMTDNLMFRSPDLYKVGIAVAAVPDQALYDSIYQERYMGLPQQNVKGYHDGSPINFAEGLRGKLLIVHGTGDDNVHFQGD
ncbi:MAG TPA: S9 family peptidase, partial [Candidatus Sulfopaludibacter sp.]|nr:S9 family peptidase [Candidatus Sulfopaludibacter sp.]